jgi:hypothetical protein
MTESEAADDLAFIKRIMKESRQLIVDDGRYYILWGLLSVALTGLSYLIAGYGMARLIPYLWGIPFAVLGILGALMGRRERKRRPRGMAGNFIAAIWLCVMFLSFALIAHAAVSRRLELSPMMGLVSIALAAGFTLSAFVMRSKAFGTLSLSWWLGGVLLPLAGGYTAPLYLAGMILLFEVLPGFIMLSAAKKAKKAR